MDAITYLPDDTVDAAADRQLRDLMTTCFTKDRDVVFRTQRYFHEPYPHRWIIREANGNIVAHVGAHEKRVLAGANAFRIGGICDVCVHPSSRGKGYVKSILTHTHAWLSEKGFDFAVLFGDPLVYTSSGYLAVNNLVYGSENEGWKPIEAMVLPLSATPWPDAEVRLPGPVF